MVGCLWLVNLHLGIGGGVLGVRLQVWLVPPDALPARRGHAVWPMFVSYACASASARQSRAFPVHQAGCDKEKRNARRVEVVIPSERGLNEYSLLRALRNLTIKKPR